MAEPTADPPANWWEYHLPSCGTEYRGCDPACPKDVYERTGKWTGPTMIAPTAEERAAEITFAENVWNPWIERYGLRSMNLEKLAEMIAAALHAHVDAARREAREACAKLAEGWNTGLTNVARLIAAAIRQRGETG